VALGPDLHTYIENICGHIVGTWSHVENVMTSEADRIAQMLASASRVVVLTGAGMSQESGVPTFRDAQQGLWSQYDPMELATADAFQRAPGRVFGWYLWRYRLVHAARPHRGHIAVAAMAAGCGGYTVVTQNVDGLHRRAGSDDVIELHGSLEQFRCFDAGHPFDASALDDVDIPESGEVVPPACEACGSPIRPGVVWFGETLPPGVYERASQQVSRCEVLLVVGTSSVVYPAAALPQLAAGRGVAVVEINPQPTPLTPLATVSWAAPAGDALAQLAHSLGVHVPDET
jgi:NAD-dependent deacetylase